MADAEKKIRQAHKRAQRACPMNAVEDDRVLSAPTYDYLLGVLHGLAQAVRYLDE